MSASTLEHEAREYFEQGFDDFVPKPFRAGQVYACLAKHLGVEFEYAQEAVSAEEAPLDLKRITLPADLLARLKAAAEVSGVTELEQILDEVEKQSPEEGRLAGHLRGLSQDFKLDEILSILDQLES